MWGEADHGLILKIAPDGILFVGDLGEGDLRLTKQILKIPIPIALILGNHDRGNDPTGQILDHQLKLLADIHCAWSLRRWDHLPLAIVGARPCSGGGGFHLSKAVKAIYGEISLRQSVDFIVKAARQAPVESPLILLAHSGPSGLGSEINSPCGRDWLKPAIDWGDKDLELAIDEIKQIRKPDLVVFGHMHHNLKRGNGIRSTFVQDRMGVSYLNAACVPRRIIDDLGRQLFHFSWVEFVNRKLSLVSHRWYLSSGYLAYEDTLFKSIN